MTKYKKKHKLFNPSALLFALHQLIFSNEGWPATSPPKNKDVLLHSCKHKPAYRHIPTHLIKFLNSSCLREGKLFHPDFQGCHF